MAEIIWTEEAERWLCEIHGYIAADNPKAAAKVIEGIFEKVQMLCRFPEIGYKYRDEPDGEIRILLYGHYRIAYMLHSQQTIYVLGVFHGAMNLARYLP